MTEFISFEELSGFVSDNKAKKALITFHSIGDRDSVASAVALASCFDDSVVATPDFITNNARRMLEQAGYRKKIGNLFPKDIEIVIVTDSNNMEVVGGFKERLLAFRGSILFVDHHAIDKNVAGRNILIFNDEKYNSASSIVYELLKLNGRTVTKELATLLINGIISDSADFQNSSALTFRQVSELLDASGLRYSQIIEHYHELVPAKKRYELIREVSGAKTEILGRYLITYGRAVDHANIAADTAIRLGADASVFWTVKKDEASISARLRSPLDEVLSIHLGEMMKRVGHVIDGNGGGHPCAAGAYGPGKERLEDAVDELLDKLKKKLEGTGRSVHQRL